MREGTAELPPASSQRERKTKPTFYTLSNDTAVFSGPMGASQEAELIGVVRGKTIVRVLSKRRYHGNISFWVERVETPKKNGEEAKDSAEQTGPELPRNFWVTKSTRGKGFIKYRLDDSKRP